MKALPRYLLSFFCLFVLQSCGGGGGGNPNGSDTNVTPETEDQMPGDFPENTENQVLGSNCSEVISSQSGTSLQLVNTDAYCDYFVDGEVLLEDVSVVVEPGTVIVFGEQAELELEGGTFESVGTIDLPIVLRGEIAQQGYWYDIRFSGMNDVNLEHTRIEDGGGVRGSYSVWLVNSDVRLVNVTVSNSGSSGLWLFQGFEGSLREFSGNQFFGNQSHGLVFSGPPASLAALDATTDYIGESNPNGTRNIVIEGLSLVAGEQLELHGDLNGDFLITNAITLNDNGTPDFAAKARLTIAAGTRLEFSYRGSIYVRSGVFITQGTEQNPVVLTGVLRGDSEEKFFGITAFGTDSTFSEGNATVEMENTVVAHGGLVDSNSNSEIAQIGAIQISGDARVNLTNVTIRDSVSYGVTCYDSLNGSSVSPENLSFDNVIFMNNGAEGYHLTCGQ